MTKKALWFCLAACGLVASILLHAHHVWNDNNYNGIRLSLSNNHVQPPQQRANNNNNDNNNNNRLLQERDAESRHGNDDPTERNVVREIEPRHVDDDPPERNFDKEPPLPRQHYRDAHALRIDGRNAPALAQTRNPETRHGNDDPPERNVVRGNGVARHVDEEDPPERNADQEPNPRWHVSDPHALRVDRGWARHSDRSPLARHFERDPVARHDHDEDEPPERNAEPQPKPRYFREGPTRTTTMDGDPELARDFDQVNPPSAARHVQDPRERNVTSMVGPSCDEMPFAASLLVEFLASGEQEGSSTEEIRLLQRGFTEAYESLRCLRGIRTIQQVQITQTTFVSSSRPMTLRFNVAGTCRGCSNNTAEFRLFDTANVGERRLQDEAEEEEEGCDCPGPTAQSFVDAYNGTIALLRNSSTLQSVVSVLNATELQDVSCSANETLLETNIFVELEGSEEPVLRGREIVSLEQGFRFSYNQLNAQNADYCDPLFRSVREAVLIPDGTFNRRRQLQQGPATTIPSAAPSQVSPYFQRQTFVYLFRVLGTCRDCQRDTNLLLDDGGMLPGRSLQDNIFRQQQPQQQQNDTCQCPIGAEDAAPTPTEFALAYNYTIRETFVSTDTVVVGVTEVDPVECSSQVNEFETFLSLDVLGFRDDMQGNRMALLETGLVRSYNQVAQSYCDPLFRSILDTTIVQIRDPPSEEENSNTTPSLIQTIFRVRGRCRGCNTTDTVLFDDDGGERRWLRQGKGPAGRRRRLEGTANQCFCSTNNLGESAQATSEFATAYNDTLARETAPNTNASSPVQVLFSVVRVNEIPVDLAVPPSSIPSVQPSLFLSSLPSSLPSMQPSLSLSSLPSSPPSMQPSNSSSSSSPSLVPSMQAANSSSSSPPSMIPSMQPVNSSLSLAPSMVPSTQAANSSLSSPPSMVPSMQAANSSLSLQPSMVPSMQLANSSLSFPPSMVPSMQAANSSLSSPPSMIPSMQLANSSSSSLPSMVPSMQAANSSSSSQPSLLPSMQPTNSSLSSQPSLFPSMQPTNSSLSSLPSSLPSIQPTNFNLTSPPSSLPSLQPTNSTNSTNSSNCPSMDFERMVLIEVFGQPDASAEELRNLTELFIDFYNSSCLEGSRVISSVTADSDPANAVTRRLQGGASRPVVYRFRVQGTCLGCSPSNFTLFSTNELVRIRRRLGGRGRELQSSSSCDCPGPSLQGFETAYNESVKLQFSQGQLPTVESVLSVAELEPVDCNSNVTSFQSHVLIDFITEESFVDFSLQDVATELVAFETSFASTYNRLNVLNDEYCDPLFRVVDTVTFAGGADLSRRARRLEQTNAPVRSVITLRFAVVGRCRGCDPTTNLFEDVSPIPANRQLQQQDTCFCGINTTERAVQSTEFEAEIGNSLRTLREDDTVTVFTEIFSIFELDGVACPAATETITTTLSLQMNGLNAATLTNEDARLLEATVLLSYNQLTRDFFCDSLFRLVVESDLERVIPGETANSAEFQFRIRFRCRGCQPNTLLFAGGQQRHLRLSFEPRRRTQVEECFCVTDTVQGAPGIFILVNFLNAAFAALRQNGVLESLVSVVSGLEVAPVPPSPSTVPSSAPSNFTVPATGPSSAPSEFVLPSAGPSAASSPPSILSVPSAGPSAVSSAPTNFTLPSDIPSATPSAVPSATSSAPSRLTTLPSADPSASSSAPSALTLPSVGPSALPSAVPSATSSAPSILTTLPSAGPSVSSSAPSALTLPSAGPSASSSATPRLTTFPSVGPSASSSAPSGSLQFTGPPSNAPSDPLETIPDTIQMDWFIPAAPSFSPMTVSVGDTIVFNWVGFHNVFIHPTGDCTEAGAILVGADTGASYTFTEDDVGDLEFVCDVGGHCEQGMRITVTVVRGGNTMTVAAPSSSPSVRDISDAPSGLIIMAAPSIMPSTTTKKMMKDSPPVAAPSPVSSPVEKLPPSVLGPSGRSSDNMETPQGPEIPAPSLTPSITPKETMMMDSGSNEAAPSPVGSPVERLPSLLAASEPTDAPSLAPRSDVAIPTTTPSMTRKETMMMDSDSGSAAAAPSPVGSPVENLPSLVAMLEGSGTPTDVPSMLPSRAASAPSTTPSFTPTMDSAAAPAGAAPSPVASPVEKLPPQFLAPHLA